MCRFFLCPAHSPLRNREGKNMANESVEVPGRKQALQGKGVSQKIHLIGKNLLIT